MFRTFAPLSVAHMMPSAIAEEGQPYRKPYSSPQTLAETIWTSGIQATPGTPVPLWPLPAAIPATCVP